MVTINDEPFPVYSLDTVDTLKQRVAAKYDSLPLYLIFDPELTETIGDYEVIDILGKIKSDQSLDITPLYEEYSQYFVDPLNLVKPWLAYNRSFENNKLLEFAAVSSVEALGLDFDAERFLKDKKTYRAEIERRIENNKRESKRLVTIFKSFQTVEGIESTEFQLDTSSFTLLLNLTNVSLLEIFNAIVLNTNIPMASVKNFFKLYRNFKPPISWSISLENAIVLKATSNPGVEIAPFKSYNDVFITLEKEGETSRVAITLDFAEKGGISKNRMKNRILDSIVGYDLKIISEREEKLKGVYYYPFQAINGYIFADLVMNDPLFSIFLTIDESLKATKSKPSIYFYFRDPQKKDSTVSAVVTEKIMTGSESEMKGYDPDLFPIDEPYLRVRISNTKNYAMVENFIGIFSKLLQIYNQKYEEILSIYREYLPDFGERKETSKSRGRERLKDIAPEIFPPLYSKKCNLKPKIVDEETATSRPEGEWILFPATPQEGKQHYYICPHKKHKYPGLFVNNLANSEKFPYLPCCYAKDKSRIKGSNYRKYFYGEEEPGEKVQQTVLSTNKIATSRGFGYLPPNLRRLFEMIDLDSIYYRKGVSRSKSSFLECVLEALYEETGFLTSQKENGTLSDKTRQKRVAKWRGKIASWEYLAVGRQELYDLSVMDIAADIGNMDIYLSPHKYIRILESYFSCNIFLFTRDISTGQLELPRFSQAYLKYNLRSRPTILIYEHWGSKAEDLTYPQCEMIVRWDTRNEVIYNLGPEEAVVQEINLILERIRKVYNFELVPEIYLPALEKLDIVSQIIDSYGKTRCLNISYEGKISSIITEPIPPLAVVEEFSRDFKPWEKSALNRFLKEIPIKNRVQNVEEDILYEVKGKYGTIDVIFPVETAKPFEKMKKVDEPVFVVQKKESDLLTYNYYKRIARYLTEYCLYIFSDYLRKNNISEVNSSVLENFTREKLVIVPSYEGGFSYKKPSKNFSLNSSLIRDGKLIVPSEEAVKRLLYVLRLKLQQQFGEVINYYQRETIANFYVDITDFDLHPDQIILQGEDSVEKWILDQESSYLLQHQVKYGEQPYFFKNEILGDDIYLAQNVESNYREGVNIGKKWVENGYNPVSTKKSEEGLAFSLYSYRNEKNIKDYKVEGKPNSYDISLLGYKKEGKSYFTVLMPIK